MGPTQAETRLSAHKERPLFPDCQAGSAIELRRRKIAVPKYGDGLFEDLGDELCRPAETLLVYLKVYESTDCRAGRALFL